MSGKLALLCAYSYLCTSDLIWYIMKIKLTAAAFALAFITSCNMENPLLTESPYPYGAPQFDKIRNEHYVPAFKAALAEAKAEIDSIVADPAEPDFRNTIEALETGREPEITGEEAKKAIALIEAIYRSSREGGWAEL